MTSIASARGGQGISALQLSESLCSQRLEIPHYFTAELKSLGAESNPVVLAESLLALAARAESRNDAGVAQAAYAYLAERGSPIQARAQRRLTVLQGAGAFGGRAERFFNQFFREATQPGPLLGMAAGGAIFRGARALAMSRMSLSGFGPVASRLSGNALGLALEAPAFVLTSRAFDRSNGPAEHFASLGGELASAYLFLGTMKGSGGAVAAIQRRGIGAGNAAWTPAAMLAGILLSHRAEEALGLRPHRDFAALLGESFASLLHLYLGGSLIQRLGGPGYRRWERTMDVGTAPEAFRLQAMPLLAGGFDPKWGRGVERFVVERTDSPNLQMSGDSPISSKPAPRIKPWNQETDDYKSLAELKAQIYPETPVTAEEIRFDDHFRYSAHLWRRWVIEDGGAVVAQAHFFQPPRMYHPRKFELSVEVHPAYRNRGLGGRLFEEMSSHLEGEAPLSLRLNVREDQKEAIRFLEKRGFVGDVREWKSTLDLRGFDRSPYAGLMQKLRQQGIQIVTLRDLQSDLHRNRKIFEMESEIIDEVPFPEPQIRLEYDYFVKTVLGNPNLLPDGYFVAVANGAYLGTSNLVLRPAQGEQGSLATRFTGVRASYRRLGLATALKIKTIEYAQDRGFPSLVTSNSSLNDGMVSLNQRLGTKRGLDWISFVKRPL